MADKGMREIDVNADKGSEVHLETLWSSAFACAEHDTSMRCPFHEQTFCKQPGSRVVFIEREPPVLFIWLRRTYLDSNNEEQKDTRPVLFPKTFLSLRSGPYTFAAALQHIGPNPAAGHYMSHVLLQASQKDVDTYASCNDATVQITTWTDLPFHLIQRQACMLVYHRMQRPGASIHDDGQLETPYARDRNSIQTCNQET